MTHNNKYCPKYKDKVLPNEKGNCSLCNAELTNEYSLEEDYKAIKKKINKWEPAINSVLSEIRIYQTHKEKYFRPKELIENLDQICKEMQIIIGINTEI